MHFLDYFMTPSRKVNDILLVFRRWRERTRRVDSTLQAPRRIEAEVILLTGDVERTPGALEMAVSLGASTRAVGFRFGPRADSAADARLTEFAGRPFPDFHAVLASVLTRVSGESLLALTPDLPGLGLGLLANFHFGTPVYLVGGSLETGAKPEEPDWSDPEYLDPRSAAWIELLSGWHDRVPRIDGDMPPPPGSPSVLPAAREFAEVFASFYRSTRKTT